jgi:two-component system chemotaxis response regulator CheY
VSSRKVLSLGQCAADHAAIAGLLRRHFGADVVPADTFEDAEAQMGHGGYGLVLVNRILDCDGTSGLDFIAGIRANKALHDLPVMLVSNHQDAQEQAVALGAVPGFGKASLGSTKTLAQLHAVLDAP